MDRPHSEVPLDMLRECYLKGIFRVLDDNQAIVFNQIIAELIHRKAISIINPASINPEIRH